MIKPEASQMLSKAQQEDHSLIDGLLLATAAARHSRVQQQVSRAAAAEAAYIIAQSQVQEQCASAGICGQLQGAAQV